MIPVRGSVRSATFPWITLALVAANVLVFLHEARLGPLLPRFVHAYGLIPSRFVGWVELGGDPLDPRRFLPLLTSMFWHGGWGHLLGNLLYLWIFGGGIEGRLGHLRYLWFYLLCGCIAGLTQVALSPDSAAPTVGASGAIAGVLGAYLMLFPRARILTFVPVFFLPWLVEIPAIAYLALWFVVQLFSGLTDAAGTAGVAWWAHAGGFVGGLVLVTVMAPVPRRAQAL